MDNNENELQRNTRPAEDILPPEESAAAQAELKESREADIERDKKRYYLKGMITGLVIAAAAAVLGAGLVFLLHSGIVGGTGTPAGATPSVVDVDYGKISAKLKKIGELVESEYLYVDDTVAENVESGIFKGYMYSLGDLYADYYSPDEFEEETTTSNGNYCGIGALMSYNAVTNTVTVMEVYDGSPAEEAGIREGDILREVNHEDISILDFETVVDEYIKGEEGTYVNLTFEREGEELSFQVERRQVEITTVKSSELALGNGKKAGYINVSSFEKATVNQFKEAMDSFDNDDYEGIIIDLRDNPGGVMNSAVMMADYILPDDIARFSDHDYDGEYRGRTLLLYTENLKGKDSAYYSSDKHSVDKKIVVLVNANSASASEILTGALKDYGAATVVGTETYGKGIVQSIVPLSDGSAVKFTTKSYFTPAGGEIHGVGIAPDVKVEAGEELLEKGADPKAPDPEVDNQLKAAMEELEK